MGSYSELSKECTLSVALYRLGLDENTEYKCDISPRLKNDLLSLVIYTPTKQSHYGGNFKSYNINNHNTNMFLDRIFKGLKTKNVYLFSTYRSNSDNKKDIYEDVINDKESMICLKCDNGVKESLFAGVRNAIAHGNIVKKDDYYILYSVDVKKDKSEFESNVNFYMKIKNLNRIKSFYKVLNLYKNNTEIQKKHR